jgi:hypothetical protein
LISNGVFISEYVSKSPNETPLPRIGGKADFVPKLRQGYSELIQAGAALPRGADLNTREPISTIQRILAVTFAAQVR